MRTRPYLLAFLLTAACTGAQTGTSTSADRQREALQRMPALAPARRMEVLTEFIAAVRLKLLVEAVPPAAVEAELHEPLPPKFADFVILRVQLTSEDPKVVLTPRLAVTMETPQGERVMRMQAPTRDDLIPLTNERLLTERNQPRTALMEGEQDRASPHAVRLAKYFRIPEGCMEGRSPCKAYILMEKPQNELPLRLDLDMWFGYGNSAEAQALWSIPLPAPGPFAERLGTAFQNTPLQLGPPQRWGFPVATLPPESRKGPSGCRVRLPDCGV